MLDFHSFPMQRQYPTWFVSIPRFRLSTTTAYSPADWTRDLAFVAQRYANLPYFFAIDVYNEPNGAVRWSSGDPHASNPGYFWKPAVESAAAAVLRANPNLLIFVQGITGNFDGIENTNIPELGRKFSTQGLPPIAIPLDKWYYRNTRTVRRFTRNRPFEPPNSMRTSADGTFFGQFHRADRRCGGMGRQIRNGRNGNGTGTDGNSGQTDAAWQKPVVIF